MHMEVFYLQPHQRDQKFTIYNARYYAVMVGQRGTTSCAPSTPASELVNP